MSRYSGDPQMKVGKRTYCNTRRGLMIGLAMACGLAAAQPKATPGVTATSIKIGQTTAFSGPASAYSVGAKVATGYFAMINEQGGIAGHKIDLIQLDDAYSPPKTFEQTRKLVEQEGVALIAMPTGSPTSISVRKYLNDKKVPQLFVGSILPAFNDPKNFPWSMGWQPNLSYEARAVGEHILKHFANAKVAILLQNDDTAKESMRILRETLGASADKMIVKTLTYEPTDPTVDSQVVSLHETGANVFINWTSPKQAAQAIRKAYEIGWHPDLEILTGNAASVSQVLTPAGLDRAKGVVTIAFLKDPGPQWASDKGYLEFVAFMQKYVPGIAIDQLAAYGYSQSQTLAQVLRQCSGDFSRENIMAQAAHLDMELPMLLPGIRVKTSPTDFAPIQKLRLQKFDGKQWQIIADS